MPTNVPRTQPAGRHGAVAAAMAQHGTRRPTESKQQEEPKAAGYGLPCLKCKLYYPADLDECPNCRTTERIGPVAPKIAAKVSQAATPPVPDSALVEQEREEFLRQFKSQRPDANEKAVSREEAACSLEAHPAGETASAEVCKTCYERLEERVDVCEAALHINLKEAAQIIYDAVWADPSDPNKTYQNAASALLTELRKRAGINSAMVPFQPLSD